jgi:hypothetical protein
MQRRRHQIHRPGRQLDFLDPALPAARSPSPEWNSLPAPTQRALTDLVTLLLVEHAGGETQGRRSCVDDH